MLALKPSTRMTNREFLAFLDARPKGEHWEVIDGAPLAMSRPSYSHEILTANVGVFLGPLGRACGCRVLRNFFFQVTANDGRMFDPDLMMRCGAPSPEVAEGFCSDALLVCETLSPSTMRYDRGQKLDAYLQHASLRQIVLLYPQEVRLEVWMREEGEAFALEPLVLRTLDDALPPPLLHTSLPLAVIYEGAWA